MDRKTALANFDKETFLEEIKSIYSANALKPKKKERHRETDEIIKHYRSLGAIGLQRDDKIKKMLKMFKGHPSYTEIENVFPEVMELAKTALRPECLKESDILEFRAGRYVERTLGSHILGEVGDNTDEVQEALAKDSERLEKIKGDINASRSHKRPWIIGPLGRKKAKKPLTLVDIENLHYKTEPMDKNSEIMQEVQSFFESEIIASGYGRNAPVDKDFIKRRTDVGSHRGVGSVGSREMIENDSSHTSGSMRGRRKTGSNTGSPVHQAVTDVKDPFKFLALKILHDTGPSLEFLAQELKESRIRQQKKEDKEKTLQSKILKIEDMAQYQALAEEDFQSVVKKTYARRQYFAEYNLLSHFVREVVRRKVAKINLDSSKIHPNSKKLKIPVGKANITQEDIQNLESLYKESQVGQSQQSIRYSTEGSSRRVNTQKLRNLSMGFPSNPRKNTRTLASANIKRQPSTDSLKLPQIRASSSIIMNRKIQMPVTEENTNNDRENARLFEGCLNLLKPSKQVRRDRKRKSTLMDTFANKKFISQAIDADEEMDSLGPSYNKILLKLPRIHESPKSSTIKDMVDENDEIYEDDLGTENRSVNRTYPGEGGDTEG
jgi:hypothetical protein